MLIFDATNCLIDTAILNRTIIVIVQNWPIWHHSVFILGNEENNNSGMPKKKLFFRSLALVIAAADLMLARFALTYSNTSAAAIYVAISMGTIFQQIPKKNSFSFGASQLPFVR